MGVKEVYRVERISKKSDQPYQVLKLVFENGYSMECFLNNEQQYILRDVKLIKQ